MKVWNVLCCKRLAGITGRKNDAKKSPSRHHCTTLSGYVFATKACINNRIKRVKQQYLLQMSLQYVELRPTSGWDRLAGLGHPIIFQRVSRIGSVTSWMSSSGRQPNITELNRGRHLCLAGRPSRWALARILVLSVVVGICLRCKSSEILQLGLCSVKNTPLYYSPPLLCRVFVFPWTYLTLLQLLKRFLFMLRLPCSDLTGFTVALSLHHIDKFLRYCLVVCFTLLVYKLNKFDINDIKVNKSRVAVIRLVLCVTSWGWWLLRRVSWTRLRELTEAASESVSRAGVQDHGTSPRTHVCVRLLRPTVI